MLLLSFQNVRLSLTRFQLQIDTFSFLRQLVKANGLAFLQRSKLSRIFFTDRKAMNPKRRPAIAQDACSTGVAISGKKVRPNHYQIQLLIFNCLNTRNTVNDLKASPRFLIPFSKQATDLKFIIKKNKKKSYLIDLMLLIAPPNEQEANKQQIHQPEQESSSFISTLFQKQYQIIKTPKHFAILLTILGILFFVLGIVTLVLSLKVKNVQVDYATMRKCKGTNIEGEKCSVKFNVKEDMEGPVYLLYSIKNVYINHRKFLNSYSPDQLKGKTISSTQATQLCGNFVYNRNIPQKNSWSGAKLNQDDIASLCGVKPQGFFNDTYALYQNGVKIPIDQSKAYTGSTIETHRQPKSDQSQWIDPENLHFKQYLLDGSLMTKRRVWGAINNGLKAGDYDLLVQNNYQMANMKIIKGILLSTSTVMGGKIFFFPVVFFMLTVTCIGLNLYLFFRFRNYSKLKQHDKLYQS